MYVTKISHCLFTSFRGVIGNNQYDYSQTKEFSLQKDTFCKNVTNTHVKEPIKSQAKFRELASKRSIHCPYCGLHMIGAQTILDMKNRGVFNSHIKNFVEEVKPYEHCLKRENKSLFKAIEIYAKKKPDLNLSSVIRIMYQNSLINHKNKQLAIFEEIAEVSNHLPIEYKAKIFKFLKSEKYKVLGIPQKEKFNGQVFANKLTRLADTLPNKKDKKRYIHLTSSLHHPSFNNNTEIPEKILINIFSSEYNPVVLRRVVSSLIDPRKKVELENRNIPLILLSIPNSGENKDLRIAFIKNMREAINNPYFKPENYCLTREMAKKIASLNTENSIQSQNLVKNDIQLYLIKEIKKIGKKYESDDIINQCNTYKNFLLGTPVVIPFSNKDFHNELVKHLKGLEKKSIYKKIMNIEKKLPVPTTNKKSFLYTHRHSNSNTIAKSLLIPSVVTIEHIKPSSHDGKDCMANWALACKEDNNARSDMSQELFLKHFDPQNPQIYFDDIIEAANEGEIDAKDVVNQAAAFNKQGNVYIDTSKLKLAC